MQRLASIRFDRVLGEHERVSVTHTLSSAGAAVGPWRTPAGTGRTYALVRFADTNADAGAREVLDTLQGLDCIVREPAATLLEIVPLHRELVRALADALGGAARPAGVIDCRGSNESVLLEFDDRVTPLSLVVDLVDIELEPAPGRRIVPLFGLSDVALAAFAADLLAEPQLDASRLIETYSEPLLAALEG